MAMDLTQFHNFKNSIAALDSSSSFKVKISSTGAYFQITNSRGQNHEIGCEAIFDAFKGFIDHYKEISHYVESCNQYPTKISNDFAVEKGNFDQIIDEVNNKKAQLLTAEYWKYFEKPIRVMSGHYFPNSRIAVVGKEQTKVFFNIISRLIFCANNISTTDVDIDETCPFSYHALTTTLDFVKNILNFYDVENNSSILMQSRIAKAVLVNESKINNFVEKVLRLFYQDGSLSLFIDRLTENVGEHDLFSLKTESHSLTSIFKKSVTKLSKSDLKMGDKVRYFIEPFQINDSYYYLSTEWTNNKGSRLDLQSFIAIFAEIYPSYSIIERFNDFILLYNSGALSSSSAGENIIYYGAPGTGKSHTIEDEIDEVNTIRTVFHADTTNSDFIGCLRPVMNGNSIKYEFRPGPFTTAVINAMNEPGQHHWLVIEEINRAPAAAVFGEIFQLLDREPKTGESRYSITLSDLDMQAYIKDKIGNELEGGKIRIPGNLTMLATMNSSDQAVMPLDTAFKRRWQFRYIPLDFDVSYNDIGKPCAEGSLSFSDIGGSTIKVSWKSFATTINKILTEQGIPEDRHLGPFFLSENEIENSNKEAMTGKLFMYLWDDVLRHGMKETVFNSEIRTYGQLTRYFDSNEKVFSDNFYEILQSPPAAKAIEFRAVAQEPAAYASDELSDLS